MLPLVLSPNNRVLRFPLSSEYPFLLLFCHLLLSLAAAPSGDHERSGFGGGADWGRKEGGGGIFMSRLACLLKLP